MTFRRNSLVASAVVLTLCGCSSISGSEKEIPVVEIGSKAINEASGLASSRRHEDVLWIVNDGPAGSILWAVGADGTVRGRIPVNGIKTSDVEDLAAFDWQGKPHLLIADVGDNKSEKGTYTLHAVPEPSPKDTEVSLTWSLRFRYEDGAHNCESVAVDSNEGQIWIITKGGKPGIYTLPLKPERGVAEAKRSGDLAWGDSKDLSLPGSLREVITGNLTTGLDFSRDGSTAAVLTYNHVFLYSRKEGEAWDVSLSRTPRVLKMPMFSQTEALTFSRTGASIWIASENLPAKMAEIPLR